MRLLAMMGSTEKCDMAAMDPFSPRAGNQIEIPYFLFLTDHDQGNLPLYQEELYIPADFDCGLGWRSVFDEHDVFGDGRVVVFATPGQSKGHQSLLVKLDSETVMLGADADFTAQNMRARALPGVVWSPDGTVASWDRIKALPKQYDARLFVSHDLDWQTGFSLAPNAWYA